MVPWSCGLCGVEKRVIQKCSRECQCQGVMHYGDSLAGVSLQRDLFSVSL